MGLLATASFSPFPLLESVTKEVCYLQTQMNCIAMLIELYIMPESRSVYLADKERRQMANKFSILKRQKERKNGTFSEVNNTRRYY